MDYENESYDWDRAVRTVEDQRYAIHEEAAVGECSHVWRLSPDRPTYVGRPYYECGTCGHLSVIPRL